MLQPKYTTSVSCLGCKKVWFKRTSQIKQWGGRCVSCSKKGSIAWNKGRRKGVSRNMEDVTCKKCDKTFKKRNDCIKNWSGYCKACLVKKNVKRTYVEKQCLVCSKMLSRSCKGGKCKKCQTSERFSKIENHPRWISDRTKLAVLSNGEEYRNSPISREWSKEVKNRDGWKCKISNSDCLGAVVAHHILSWRDHPELRYQTNNGITLCHAHHPRKRAEEKRLIPTFLGLVSVSNKQ